MSVKSLLNFGAPKTPVFTLTPFQSKMVKEGLTCLWAIPFAIVTLLGVHAIYEWIIQIAWGLINMGQFRTYTMATLVANISFVASMLFLAARFVYHRETVKKTAPTKAVLTEAA